MGPNRIGGGEVACGVAGSPMQIREGDTSNPRAHSLRRWLLGCNPALSHGLTTYRFGRIIETDSGAGCMCQPAVFDIDF